MKKTRIISIVALAIVCSLLSAILLAIPAAAKTAEEVFTLIERDAMEQQEVDNYKAQIFLEDELNRWAKKQKSDRYEKKIQDFADVLEIEREHYASLANIAYDAMDGGDFDTAACINDIADLASSIASACGPIGGIVGGVIEIGQQIFNAVMGGTPGPSEIALLKDEMQQQFNKISDEISELGGKFGDLSDEINDSTNKIIASVSTALDDFAAKEDLKKFMLSTEGNFSYNQYRNYIYGELEDNSRSNSAYYALLQDTLLSGASDDVVKYYYDKLYSSLTEGYDAYYEYIVGDGIGKSIVQSYYSVVSKRPDLLAEQDMSPEMAAVAFAYDLYENQLMADKLLLICNNYQYQQMLLTKADSYVCGSEIITEDFETLVARILLREEEIRLQFAADLAYIFKTNKSVVIKNGERLYTQNTEEDGGMMYANVLDGQTVYLNRIPQSVCELFDLRADGFVYSVGALKDQSGILSVDTVGKNATVKLQYKYENTDGESAYKDINTLILKDGAQADFCGGSGTAADPYLIASAKQFANIANGLDKCYRLVSDIDFAAEGAQTPFGYHITDNTTAKYDAFTGILDGDGYTLYNLTIQSSTMTGLFGHIGWDGVVKDLTLNSVTVTGTVTAAKEKTSIFYIGAIAGLNEGSVKNCRIENASTVKITLTNSEYDRNVYVYAGGIAGYNGNIIYGCYIDGATVSLDSTHDFFGSSTVANLHKAYAGGIAGYNVGYVGYSIVIGETSVSALATSRLSPMTTVNPYIDAYAGGIVGKLGKNVPLSNITHVYSEASAFGKGKVSVYDSNWAELYRNVKEDSSPYVADVDKAELESIKDSVANIKAAFIPEQYTVELSNVPEQIAGSGEFTDEGMVFTVNGKGTSFDVLSTYGFDSYNASTQTTLTKTATVLLVATVGDRQEMFAVPVKYVVGPDFVVSVSAKAVQTVFKKGEVVQSEDLILHCYYACSDVLGINPESTQIVNANTATQEYGTATVVVEYEGLTATVDISVECGHRSNTDYSDTSVYTLLSYGVENGSVKATCNNSGYDVYRCNECGAHVKTNYTLPLATHVIEREVVKEATCLEEGDLGKVYCSSCGEVFYEGGVIPRKPHNYYLDTSKGDYADYHYCSAGEHKELHQYIVTENSTEDGTVYIYTCYEEKCGYSYTKADSNIVTDELGKAPQVVVSDGFALNGGDLATVYVQLINNPGVDGAHFGIRYDSKLELADIPTEGTLFENTFAKDSAPVSCGYNFVWADEATKTEDGNLLKLVFRMPEDAAVGDVYRISVVYNSIATGVAEGGFGIDLDYVRQNGITTTDKVQQFLTKDGYVRIVEHLPGDINSDNAVDLLDALYICSILVGNRTATAEAIHYGDLDLDGEIGIYDVLTVLRTLYGGSGVNCLYHEYKLALNSNGYGATEYTDVRLYDEEHNYGTMTYADAGVTDLSRAGYKFLGWYKRLDGTGDKPIKYTDIITYDVNQKQQMIYARWEKNSVSFDMNGATSTPLSSIAYAAGGSNVVTLTTPAESYRIVFVGDTKNSTGTLSQSFKCWEYGVKTYSAGQTIDLAEAGLGKIELTAQWKDDWKLTSSGLTKVGYRDIITWYYDSNKVDPVGDVSDIAVLKNIKEKAVNNNNQCELHAVWNTPIEYKIKYDLGGGSCTKAPTSAAYNASVDISHPTRTGYTFAGWTITGMDTGTHTYRDSNGETYTSTAKTLAQNFGVSFRNLTATDGATVTFKATWTAHTYTVKYYGNGATSGSTADSDHTYDVSKALTANGFKRTGYTFLGWSEDASATSATYTDKQSVSNLTTVNGDTIELYAIWREHTYNIVYNANGGSGSMSATTGCYYDNWYTLRANAFTRTGYTFLGWSEDANATTATYANGASVSKLTATDNGTVELYAIWREHTYNIVYHANGGSGSMSNTDGCYYDDFYTLRANSFTRTDYTFLGWSTNPSAITPTYADKEPVSKLTATDGVPVDLYAIWVKTSYTFNEAPNVNITTGSYICEIHPGMDIVALGANKYTKFSVTFSAYGRGCTVIAGHKPRVQVFSRNNTLIAEKDLPSFDGSWGSWSTRTTTVEINLVDCYNDGSFWYAWQNSGSTALGDGWCLNFQTITVTAIK